MDVKYVFYKNCYLMNEWMNVYRHRSLRFVCEVKVEESLLNEPSPRPSSKMAGELSSPFSLLSLPLLGPPFSFLSSCLSDQKEAKG